MSALTREQLGVFGENGYLILERVFDDSEVMQLQREADHILELMVNSSLASQRLSTRLDWRINSRGEHIVRKIQPINDLSLLFTNVAADERLTGPLHQIMGEDPVLMEEKLNYKQPLPNQVEGLPIRQMDDDFPIHNDWAYQKNENYPQSNLSSALLLDHCTPDNGPIRVWPGSHRQHLEHVTVANGLQVKPGLIDFDGGIDVAAPAGSVVIFHILLVHNSRPNTSGRPRRLMIYSHYPASANMPFDARNGGFRLAAAPWEWEYLRMKQRREFTDRFTAPSYGDG